MLNVFYSYRSHKNFLASYLGTEAEQEKLQKPISDVVVWELEVGVPEVLTYLFYTIPLLKKKKKMLQ